MRGRTSASIVANPVLVGSITTLIVLVAVFLAYNANNGLPFVPTRQIKAHVASGANLVKGNEVREGGFRVGVIEELKPITMPDGSPAAELKLKLDKKIGDIPKDTQVKIRPRSALGLKFLELQRGKSKEGLKDGDTLPLSQSIVPVQFDDIFKIFDEPTRIASRKNLDGFGNTFAGRGSSINAAIEDLPRLFRYLEPVARNLASDRTNIGRFFNELGDAARIVAPLAETQARLFTRMADTFEAFSRDPEALKATIEKSPSTLDVATESLRVQRPFLRDTAAFSRDLRFAVRSLRFALPHITPAIIEGQPVLRRTPVLNEETRKTLVVARELAADPNTRTALRALTATVTTLNPQLRFLGPYQTVCNNWNYFWTYLAEHFSESVSEGNAQRALVNSTAQQTNSIGSAGAYEPANGKGYIPGQEEERGDIMYFHGQPYSAAVDNEGNADCEFTQRGYPSGRQAVFAGPEFKVVGDPHTPGNQGPTYKGRSRVPRGQTFTREPDTGPQLEKELTTGIYGG